MATKAMTSGKAKKSGAPRKAPKVAPPKPSNGNYMKEYDVIKNKGKSPMAPMTGKKLSK
jgi:hypothetical protein